MPVLDRGAFDGEGEHRRFGVGERPGARLPEAAAVLQVRAEHLLEEGGRHFVVLRVGRFGMERDWAAAQFLDEPVLAIEAQFLSQSRPEQGADAGAHDDIGHSAAFEERFVPGGRSHSLGIQGKKALVVC